MTHRPWSTVRRLVVALAAVAVMVAPTPAAFAAEDPSVQDVIAAVNPPEAANDYIVLIDTSASMQEENRWPRLVGLLTQLANEIGPSDRLTVITFDKTAKQVYRGPVAAPGSGATGLAPEVVLGKLPKTPTGTLTDIGSAVELAIGALERVDAMPVGTVLLFTDGVIEAAADSKYPRVDSPAWDKLKTRFKALRNVVIPIAVPLASETDAAPVAKIFDAAVIQPEKLYESLSSRSSDLMTEAAVKSLTTEVARAKPVAVSFETPEAQINENGELSTTVKFANPYRHIPLVLTGVTAKTEDGRAVNVVGLPSTIELVGGATAQYPLAMTFPGKEATATKLTFEASLASPWASALKTMGITFEPKIGGSLKAGPAGTVAAPSSTATATTEPSPAATDPAPADSDSGSSLPIVPIAAGVGGLVLLGGVFMLLRRRKGGDDSAVVSEPRTRRAEAPAARAVDDDRTPAPVTSTSTGGRGPEMAGSLSVLQNGQLVYETMLVGKSMALEGPLAGMRGTVTGIKPVKGADGELHPAVQVQAQFGDRMRKMDLPDGEDRQLGAYTIRYTGPHSRVMQRMR